MAGWVILMGMLVAGMTAFVLALWLFLRVVLWIVLLPFKVLFLAVAIPLFFVKLVVGFIAFLLFFVLAFGSLIALAGIFVAVLVPLLPFAILAFAIWALVRITKRPIAA
jgi:hypothetical protein